jgi:hypothetical protein
MADKREYPPMKLADEFRFGKHIGTTVEDVITGTPTYIKWAIDECVIKLDNDAFALYESSIAEWELSNPKKS